MRDNSTTPNSEPPPNGGGRVAYSRAARYAQQPPGEYPYPQGHQPPPDGYGDGSTQAWSAAGGQPPRPPAPDGYGHPSGGSPAGGSSSGNSPTNGSRTGRFSSSSFPSGSFPPSGNQDPRQQRDAYARPVAYGRNGNPAGGHAPNGYTPNGHTPNGHSSNGYPSGRDTPSNYANYAPDGYAPTGYAPGGENPGGYAPNGYAPNGYPPNGYAPNGYTPNGHSSNGYAPGGHPQRVVPSRAARHAPGRVRGGYREAVAPSRNSRYSRPPATTRQARHTRRRQRSFWTELPVLIIAAFVLAIGVKGYVVQAFYIPSGSMQPTLQINDRVLVNRLEYRAGTTPEHGDVVVFVREIPGAPPPEQGAFGAVQRAVAQGLGNAPPGSEDLIKRVMGRQGDVVEGRDGRLWRNGQPLDEPYLVPGTLTDDFGPLTVAPGHMWVMGDNRGDSADSRAFGQVPMEALVGRAVVLVWPFDHVGGL